MVDPVRYAKWFEHGSSTRLALRLEQPSSPLRICSCDKCEEVIYQRAIKPRFLTYNKVNPLVEKSLTDHQYFLCDKKVEAFVFNIREWSGLYWYQR